ncbi:MAG TPA: STY0301 family protein [Verrucomicrobiae bacterium]|jgi:hypothetical protein|nr:STY0301 family protein [Verrucomicrobiae bacterium]
MMWRTMLLCTVSALIFCSFSAAADTTICPTTVDVKQQLASSVDGWTPTLDDSPHRLSGITFYDGPPQEKASLVYDNIKKTAPKEIATWQFGADGKRPTWIVCSYSGTAVQLAKSLPSKTSTCQITYNRTQQLSGQPLIESVSCK